MKGSKFDFGTSEIKDQGITNGIVTTKRGRMQECNTIHESLPKGGN